MRTFSVIKCIIISSIHFSCATSMIPAPTGGEILSIPRKKYGVTSMPPTPNQPPLSCPSEYRVDQTGYLANLPAEDQDGLGVCTSVALSRMIAHEIHKKDPSILGSDPRIAYMPMALSTSIRESNPRSYSNKATGEEYLFFEGADFCILFDDVKESKNVCRKENSWVEQELVAKGKYTVDFIFPNDKGYFAGGLNNFLGNTEKMSQAEREKFRTEVLQALEDRNWSNFCQKSFSLPMFKLIREMYIDAHIELANDQHGTTPLLPYRKQKLLEDVAKLGTFDDADYESWHPQLNYEWGRFTPNSDAEKWILKFAETPISTKGLDNDQFKVLLKKEIQNNLSLSEEFFTHFTSKALSDFFIHTFESEDPMRLRNCRKNAWIDKIENLESKCTDCSPQKAQAFSSLLSLLKANQDILNTVSDLDSMLLNTEADFRDLLFRLLTPGCKKSGPTQVKLPESISCHRKKKLKDNQFEIEKDILNQLKAGRLVGVAANAGVFHRDLKKVPVNETGHAMVVVGMRKRKESGCKPEYLIWNSWGTDCAFLDNGIECDPQSGKFWLPENLFYQSLKEFYVLSQ